MKSNKKKLEEKIFDLIREKLILERGELCQICGRTNGLGLFHILSRGSHPRLKFAEKNILISCWMPCHHNWHHDYFKARMIEDKIKNICGDNYEEELLMIEKTIPKINEPYLRDLLLYYSNTRKSP